MPYPTQITRETVIDKARDLIEAEGLEQVSLNRLAGALNVKAPSLYRYFEGKNDLLRAVNDVTSHALVEAVSAALVPTQGNRKQLMAMSRAYYDFAHRYPMTYQLLFANLEAGARTDADESEQLVLPLQAVMAKRSGEADSLAALRGLLALLHGYVTLELNGQFRRGGDLDAMFARVVEAYIDGWS